MSSKEGLDAYLDFLDTSSSSLTEKDPCPTPRIDTVLQSYKQKSTSPALGSRGESNYESRLIQLEKQLTALLQKTKASPVKEERQPKRPKPDTEDNTSDESHTIPSHTQHNTSPSQSSEQMSFKSTRSQTRQTEIPVKSSSSCLKKPNPVRKKEGNYVTNQTGSSSSPPTHTRVATSAEDQKTKNKLLKDSRRRPGTEMRNKNVVSVKTLTNDLDKERERRMKAEQAAEHLVNHVRTLQTKLTDVQTKHELCVVRNSHLDQELKRDKETVNTLQSQLEQLGNKLEASSDDMKKMKTSEEEQMIVLRTLEENCRKFETEKIQERSEFMARVGDAEAKAIGHQKEVELLSKTVRHLKVQLQQMNELLANREREHQRAMEICKPMESKEIQELISKEVQFEKTKMTALLEQQKQKIAEQEKAYQNLEDEFRMALRIETGRFQELHRTYEQVSSDVESSRETAIAAVQKEQRANGMIVELTALAKEQKGRIEELGRGKKESVTQFKERVGVLEGELLTKNKLEMKLQSLQEENCRLLSKVQAQESVIEGLREERQLWGKELAHQGATLAQDRGRLEAQVDALSEEVKSTREQLQREREALRIKEKQVEDQLRTIHQLKQSLSGKEHEVQSLQLDWQREQQTLHLQLDQEQSENQDLQDQLSGLVERKEALKDELATCQEKLQQWKVKYNKLKVQWDEKLQLLTSLEESTGKLQQTFSDKQANLLQEKEAALEEARTYQQRLKSCDDAFREQLEAKQRSHDSHMAKILAEKEQEIQQANQKVVSVEGEMREVLSEVSREKKNMETKFQKLLRAFQELRLDITE